MRRRDFLATVGLALATHSISPNSAKAVLLDSFIPPDFSKEPAPYKVGALAPSLEDMESDYLLRTGPNSPLVQEITLAKDLLKTIPTSGTPYDIAHEFHRWRKGLVGKTEREREVRSYYAREWPERGNPVIMQFFDATGLREIQGDTTWWCAAFVSWCIGRSKGGVDKKPRTWPYAAGAASASYRSWGEDVLASGLSPRRGDLAVFKNTKLPNNGHVGFVHSIDGDLVLVLGGNQGAQNEYNGGEVNIAAFDIKKKGRLQFHSFRRHEALG